MPEVLRIEAESKDGSETYLKTTAKEEREALPLVCLYDGISLLQRLPTANEQPIDILQGYKTKSDFVQLLDGMSKEECQDNLKSTYETEIDGRLLDGLLPHHEEWVGNKFLDVYSHFCKGSLNTTQGFYSEGLKLWTKLEKISAYDKCNQQAAAKSPQDYCQSFFQPQKFAFWTADELKDTCQSIAPLEGRDACASLNEAVFQKYQAHTKKWLKEFHDFTLQALKGDDKSTKPKDKKAGLPE